MGVTQKKRRTEEGRRDSFISPCSCSCKPAKCSMETYDLHRRGTVKWAPLCHGTQHQASPSRLRHLSSQDRLGFQASFHGPRQQAHLPTSPTCPRNPVASPSRSLAGQTRAVLSLTKLVYRLEGVIIFSNVQHQSKDTRLRWSGRHDAIKGTW